MTLRRVMVGTRPAYSWGRNGTAFAFDAEDRASRRRALRRAQAEGLGVSDADDTTDPRWKIGAPQAPSARGLSNKMRRWMRGYMGPILKEVEEAGREWERRREATLNADAEPVVTAEEAVDLSIVLANALRRALQRRLPGLPQSEIDKEIEKITRVSSAGARRRMAQLGANRERMASALGVKPRDALAITGELSPPERQAMQSWVSGIEVEAPDGKRQTGLAKIKTLPQTEVQGLESKIVPDRLAGKRWSTISKDLQKQLGIAERHADLLARDQVGKLSGAITEATQVAAGVTEYIWRSSRDERVRDLHDDLNGRTFRHDDPPESGTNGERLPPGLPIQCRCWEDPVIPDRLIA